MKRYTLEWEKKVTLTVIATSLEEAQKAAKAEDVDDWEYEDWESWAGSEREIDDIGKIDQVVVNGELKHLFDATEDEKIELGILKARDKETDDPVERIAIPKPDDPSQGKIFE